MPINVIKSWKSVSQSRQPFKCMARCVIYGFGIGVALLLIGIPLLIFFGANLKEDDSIKKIPAWIGLITAGTGLMAVIMGVTLLTLLCRLVSQQEAGNVRNYEHGGVALLQPIGGPSPYPADTVYAPTVYNIDSNGPVALYRAEEKQEERHIVS